jgi:hypothetical protein
MDQRINEGSGTYTSSPPPPPEDIPVWPPEVPTAGWWTDPYRPGPDPKDPKKPAPGPLCQRFHDGVRWTPYISYRVERHVNPTGWSTVAWDAEPLAGPPPPLGPRDIDNYDFLPHASFIEFDPPDPVVAGWWRDPFGGFGQRYHDGVRWTQYYYHQPPRGAASRFETPAAPRTTPS